MQPEKIYFFFAFYYLYTFNLTISYIIGQNLIQNPYFHSTIHQINGLSSIQIQGWLCQPNCFNQNLINSCQNSQYKQLWCAIKNKGYNQLLNLNSGFHRKVSQKIKIQLLGYYKLSIKWVVPVRKQNNGSFTVVVNNTKHWDCKPTNKMSRGSLIQLQKYQFYNQGQIEIVFQLSSAVISGFGVFVAYAEIRYIGQPKFRQFIQNIQYTTQNIATTSYNNFPGSRVLVKVLSSSFANLDRLNFYYLHRQNTTPYMQIFLSTFFKFSQQKGNIFNIFQQIDQFQFINDMEYYQNTIQYCLQQKYKYTNNYILQKNIKGQGFVSNILDLFTIKLPFLFMLHLLLIFIFKMTVKYKISKFFRKYYFKIIFLFMLYEGAVEEITFYFFSQSINLFSKNIFHKFTNIFIIFIYFIVIIYSFSILLWIRFSYQKKAQYFIQNYKNTLISFVMEMTDSSIFPIMFGVIHLILINNYNLQTIFLIIIQLIFSFVKIYSLSNNFLKKKFKIFSSLISNVLRILIIIINWVIDKYQINISLYQINITNNVSEIIIYSFLGNQILQMIIDFLNSLCYFICYLFIKEQKNNLLIIIPTQSQANQIILNNKSIKKATQSVKKNSIQADGKLEQKQNKKRTKFLYIKHAKNNIFKKNNKQITK